MSAPLSKCAPDLKPTMTTSKRQKVQRLLKLFDGDHEIYVDGAKAEKVRVSEAIGQSENQVVYLEWQEGQ